MPYSPKSIMTDAGIKQKIVLHPQKICLHPKDFVIAWIINTVLYPPSLYILQKWRFIGVMASVSERNLKARETGGLSIASGAAALAAKPLVLV